MTKPVQPARRRDETGAFRRILDETTSKSAVAHRVARGLIDRDGHGPRVLVVTRDRAAAFRLSKYLVEADLLRTWRYADSENNARDQLIHDRFDLVLVEPELQGACEAITNLADSSGHVTRFIPLDSDDETIVARLRAELTPPPIEP